MARKLAKTTARGYGAEHKAARQRMQRMVDAGQAVCSICSGHINPGEPWDADHTDDRTGYRGPAHMRCNRRAGAIKGNRIRRGLIATPRRWKL